MIVRVLHDRQYDVPESAVERLEALDLELDKSLSDDDGAAFAAALAELVATVREVGVPLPVEALVPSDRTVPAPWSTLEDLRELLASDAATGPRGGARDSAAGPPSEHPPN